MNIDVVSDSIIWFNLSVGLLLLFVAKKRAKTMANPVTFALVIHFFHNWAFDFASRFVALETNTPESPTSMAIFEVRLTNLFGIIALCIPMIWLMGKRPRFKQKSTPLIAVKPQLLEAIYIATLPLPFLLGTGSTASGQALTSLEAFNPIGVLLLIRSFLVINAISYRIYHKMNAQIWSLVVIFILEGIFMLVFGWRKVFMIIVCSTMIMMVIRWGVPKLRNVILAIFLGLVLVIVGQFVADTRQSRQDVSFGESVKDYVKSVRGDPVQWIGRALVLTSSEGVQYWSCDVWSQSSVDYLLGRSYLQAAVNTVVPRVFQGDVRDWQAAYAFKYQAYANEVEMGYDFSFSAEAIINWGPYFSWISFLILGVLWGQIWRFRYSSIWWFNLNAVFAAVTVVAFRADSVAFARFVFVGTVPFYMISLLFAYSGFSSVSRKESSDVLIDA